MRTLTTSLLVLATIAVAILPIFGDQASKEVARWHIAAAMNAAELDIGDVEVSLAKAKSWAGEDLSSMRDYWLFRVRLALRKEPENTSKVIEEALEASTKYRSLAIAASLELMDQQRFIESASVLALAKDETWNEKPLLLNQLSYTRALAAVDLDEALVDIDKAIELEPESPGLLDTRAWVLYQTGRSVDALSDINYAIQLADRERSRDWLGRALEGLSSLNEDDPAEPTAVAQADREKVDEAGEGKDLASPSLEGAGDSGTGPTQTSDTDESMPIDEAEAELMPQLNSPLDQLYPGWDFAPDLAPVDALGYRPFTQVEAGTRWEMGVYRYHRAKILEALGRTAEAERDMKWIRDNKLPPDDRLY